MSLIVQKYGGTSVADISRIKNVAARVARWRKEGHELAVVVSARSGVTNELIARAKEIKEQPAERELDVLLAIGEQETMALLAMALHDIGVPACSFTGAQAGIITDDVHTKARIRQFKPDRVEEMRRCLKRGEVVIVAGFQGQTEDGSVTTLGRGGSDLSAVAIAHALGADSCQIYTDVDGVYTTDPRIVSAAAKIRELSYEEMLEMASAGSKVMQARSVEFANKFGVKFEVRSSMNDNPGTIVKGEDDSMEQVVVRGVSLDRHQAKITVAGVPDKPGVAAKLFGALAGANVNVDMIVQNVSASGVTDISFTVNRDELPKARVAVGPLVSALGAAGFSAMEGIAKISVVGIGMRSHGGVAAGMFQALAAAGLNIRMISTSEIKISVIVDEENAERGVAAVHEKFGLGAHS